MGYFLWVYGEVLMFYRFQNSYGSAMKAVELLEKELKPKAKL